MKCLSVFGFLIHELNIEKVEVAFIINQLLTNKTCDLISFNSG